MLQRPFQLPYRAAFSSPLNSPYPASAPVVEGVTWDAAAKGAAVTLSDGNLKASALSSNAGDGLWARSTTSKSSGKSYFELRGLDAGGSFGQIYFGVCTAAFAGNAFAEEGITCWHGSPSAGLVVPMQADEVIGFAVDYDAQKMWIRNAAGWVSGDESPSDPATGVGPSRGTGSLWGDANLGNAALYAFVELYGDAVPSYMTANFGASAFAYTPPTGFSAWDA